MNNNIGTRPITTITTTSTTAITATTSIANNVAPAVAHPAPVEEPARTVDRYMGLLRGQYEDRALIAWRGALGKLVASRQAARETATPIARTKAAVELSATLSRVLANGEYPSLLAAILGDVGGPIKLRAALPFNWQQTPGNTPACRSFDGVTVEKLVLASYDLEHRERLCRLSPVAVDFAIALLAARRTQLLALESLPIDQDFDRFGEALRDSGIETLCLTPTWNTGEDFVDIRRSLNLMMTKLQGCGTLKTLYVNSPAAATAILPDLMGWSPIRTLVIDLNGAELRDATVNTMMSGLIACQSLETLSIFNCALPLHQFNDCVIDKLAVNPRLRTFSIRMQDPMAELAASATLWAGTLVTLAAHPGLKNVSVEYPICKEGPEFNPEADPEDAMPAVKKAQEALANCRWTHLSLKGTAFCDTMALVFEGLATNKTVVNMNLADCSFSHTGAVRFINALSNNKSIVALTVPGIDSIMFVSPEMSDWEGPNDAGEFPAKYESIAAAAGAGIEFRRSFQDIARFKIAGRNKYLLDPEVHKMLHHNVVSLMQEAFFVEHSASGVHGVDFFGAAGELVLQHLIEAGAEGAAVQANELNQAVHYRAIRFTADSQAIEASDPMDIEPMPPANLHMAAHRWDLASARQFMAAGVDINSRNAQGQSVLHALLNRYSEPPAPGQTLPEKLEAPELLMQCIDTLVSAGADPMRPDGSGKTFWDQLLAVADSQCNDVHPGVNMAWTRVRILAKAPPDPMRS
jgi:hypothetical protein